MPSTRAPPGLRWVAASHWVTVSPDRGPERVLRFGCFTVDLRGMARWLIAKGVRSVAMQSTGVYWMPGWNRMVWRYIW